MAADSSSAPALEIRRDVVYAVFRERGNPLLPPAELLTASDLLADRDSGTYLTVKFDRIKRFRRSIDISVNGHKTPIPVTGHYFIRVSQMPVLLFPVSPNSLRRLALLTPAVGAVNEVSLRPARISPIGDDGFWLPERTRTVTVAEIRNWTA